MLQQPKYQIAGLLFNKQHLCCFKLQKSYKDFHGDLFGQEANSVTLVIGPLAVLGDLALQGDVAPEYVELPE